MIPPHGGGREREVYGLSPGIDRPKNSIEDLAPSRSGTLFIKVPLGEKLGHSCCSKKATIRSGIPKTCARYIGFKVCPGCCVARRVIERRLKGGKKRRGERGGSVCSITRVLLPRRAGIIECGGNYARELDNL